MTEFSFMDLVKQQTKTEEPVEKMEVPKEEGSQVNKGGDDGESSEETYLPDPGRNRLTSVIDNIERMYGDEDLGYDREDSFIDDSDMVYFLRKKKEKFYLFSCQIRQK